MRRYAVGLLLFGITSVSFGQVTISNGGSTFGWANTNSIAGSTVRTGTGGGGNVQFTSNGSSNNMFQQWWWFRANGANTREFALSNLVGSPNIAGNAMTLHYSEAEGFDADVAYTLTNQSNGTLLTATVTLSTAVTGPAVNLSFFNYFDFDVAGTSAGDSGTLMSDNPALRMRIVDTNGSIAEARALDASAYQVGSFSNVRNLLTNANADNLNNTGLPFGPGDFTGAVQWDVLLNPGNTITLQSSFLLNPVPEPATMTALALGAVALLRRRRK